MSDTASNLMVAAKDAVKSYKGLRDNTNVSNTALAQSQNRRNGDARQPHRFHGSVNGISGGDRGGGGL